MCNSDRFIQYRSHNPLDVLMAHCMLRCMFVTVFFAVAGCGVDKAQNLPPDQEEAISKLRSLGALVHFSTDGEVQAIGHRNMDTPFTHEWIEPLREFPNLEMLVISDNCHVSDQEIESLKANLANCVIHR
jgi:hypothetical protein